MAIRIGFVMFIVFIVCISALSGSAAMQGNIDLKYDVSQMPDTIRPESDVVRLSVNISYFVSGFLSQWIVPLFDAWTVPITLSVENVPEFVTAEVVPDIVYPRVSLTKSDIPERGSLTVSVSPDAPAFQTVSFKVVAEAEDVKGWLGRRTVISGITNEIMVEITPGYYSNFQYDYRPFYEMSPAEMISIPIKMVSYSNARSLVRFEILESPENWSVSIQSEYFMGTEALGEDNTGSVDIQVRSPDAPGYYNEVKIIPVRVITVAAGHPESGVDNVTVLQFTVRCNGSVEDEDVVESTHVSLQVGLVIIAGGGIVLVVVILRKKR